jgi:hypothetical protein
VRLSPTAPAPCSGWRHLRCSCAAPGTRWRLWRSCRCARLPLLRAGLGRACRRPAAATPAAGAQGVAAGCVLPSQATLAAGTWPGCRRSASERVGCAPSAFCLPAQEVSQGMQNGDRRLLLLEGVDPSITAAAPAAGGSPGKAAAGAAVQGAQAAVVAAALELALALEARAAGGAAGAEGQLEGVRSCVPGISCCCCC